MAQRAEEANRNVQERMATAAERSVTLTAVTVGLTFATAVMVIAQTIIGSRGVRLTERGLATAAAANDISRRSIQVAEEAHRLALDRERAAQRAYAWVDGATLKLEGESPAVELSVRNSGKTPAIDLTIFCHFSVGFFAEGPDDMGWVPPHEDDHPIPGVTYEAPAEQSISVELKGRRNVGPEPNGALVSGTLYYWDTYGQQFRSPFKFYSRAANGPMRPTGRDLPPRFQTG